MRVNHIKLLLADQLYQATISGEIGQRVDTAAHGDNDDGHAGRLEPVHKGEILLRALPYLGAGDHHVQAGPLHLAT
jgi:hypothetical protein